MRSYNTTTTRLFAPDQVKAETINYWNSPFSTLYNDVASGGIIFTLKEPTSTGAFGSASGLKADLAGATAANLATTWGSASATTVVSGGRMPNAVGYWAGGAPGHHGASVGRRVAYRLEMYLRSTSGRGWWSTATTPAFWLAIGGNGFLRVTKTVSGTTTDVFNGTITEGEYLQKGLYVSSAVTTMSAGDKLDIYYVQDNDTWGGFVVKAVAGAIPASTTAQQAAARTAPILGCSIFDDGSPPTMQTWDVYDTIELTRSSGNATRATIAVPLINMANDDNVGWEWYYPTAQHPGQLRLHTLADTTIDVYRQRLVRIKAGLVNEQYTIFTGFIDDYRADGATGEITCLGVEQRLADQFQKNYPDKISYMSYGYRKTSGTSEPVYDLTAYDNWPLEYALRDLMIRAGIDEHRTRKQLSVPKADGTTTDVYI